MCKHHDRDDNEGAVGKTGILLQTGARAASVGGNDRNERVIINACPEAGIIIDGPGTRDHVLSNIDLGPVAHRGVDTQSPDTRRNALGLVLRNGTLGNTIGIPGPLLNARGGFGGFPPQNTSVIVSNAEGAALTLDSCGGGGLDNGQLVDANVIRTCNLSGGTGLRITSGARANVIGSHDARDRNIIGMREGGTASIHIDGNVIPQDRQLVDRNRFLNNFVSSAVFTDEAIDLFAETRGVGVLISNGASGNVFGESVKSRNFVSGVLIDSASGNVVRSTSITGFGPARGHRAGVILRNASGNVVGGLGPGQENEILHGLFAAPVVMSPDSAGIALVGGSNNTIRGNTIEGHPGHGVLIDNSRANLIGGQRADGNRIGTNAGSGITVRGMSSQANLVAGNWIGTDRAGNDLGNEAEGVRIEGAAAANRIGGEFPSSAGALAFRGTGALAVGYSGNDIAFNALEGVLLEGPETEGNPVRYNSIHTNGGRGGIAISAGAANGLQVTGTGSHGVDQASGEITNLGEIPPGSIVQLFADRASQGEVYLGQGLVRIGGSWRVDNLPPLPFTNINYTVTVPDESGFGDTSELMPLISTTSAAFRLARTGAEEPVPRVDRFRNGSLTVLAITLIADSSPVLVRELEFEASGTLNESTQLNAVRLIRDTDSDGLISASDEVLISDGRFDANDGKVRFEPGSLVVSPNVPLNLLVSYEAAGEIPEGTTLQLAVTSVDSVGAVYLYPPADAVPNGVFPLNSDMITIGEAPVGENFADWQAKRLVGLAEMQKLPIADPDGDGVPNLIEFAFGTDPMDRSSMAQIESVTRNGRRGIMFPSAEGIVGVALVVEGSTDLRIWNTAAGSLAREGERQVFTASQVTAPPYLRLRLTLEE